MIIGNVVGNVWATRKNDSLTGLKLMIVQRLDVCSNEEKESFVAADLVGAGIGERVLVATGSAARQSAEMQNALVDATIIGIIDEVDVPGEN
ncbi:MAG: EutN/CcmL family microcompartment protein [Candidatus Fermentibacteria bacterium]|nr:EutN/CcmL family microcompartment protein [Candidatus Fermentibacteria bacterium]